MNTHASDPDISYRANSLPAVLAFENVLVTPSPDRKTPGVLWPDFDQQTYARLYHSDRPICTPPVITSGKLRIFDAPAIFVSMYDNHFGHTVAETVPRLAQALADCPEDWPLVFTCRQKLVPPDLSPMFRAVMDWLDVPLERILLCSEQTVFRQLHVAAQAEHLNSRQPTSDHYLDLLETRVHHKLPDAPKEGIAFISRAALPARKGIHAAEGYLGDCLRQLGVQVVYPEELPLAEQMHLYASRCHLVFSEGSAIHGRQLIGRQDQHISVLRRRKGSRIAQAQIEPRCTKLDYVSCYGGALSVTGSNGKPVLHAMVSLYRVERLHAYFDSIGVPLRTIWNDADYREARDRDVLRWLNEMYNLRLTRWLRPTNAPDHILQQLDALGLGHLSEQAAAIMSQHSAKSSRSKRRRDS